MSHYSPNVSENMAIHKNPTTWMDAAKAAGSVSGVNPNFIYEQWAFESNNFTAGRTKDNNPMNRKNLKGDWMSFGSPEEAGKSFGGYLKRRYPEASGARTEEEYASIMRSHGYWTDSTSVAQYAGGMKHFAITLNVGGATVNVTNPGASADEIANKVAERQGIEISRRLREFSGVYGG